MIISQSLLLVLHAFVDRSKPDPSVAEHYCSSSTAETNEVLFSVTLNHFRMEYMKK